MRRGLLALLLLAGSSSAAFAQDQFFSPFGATPQTTKVSADEVVARIMTFDQNSDGRVSIGELSERMRPLVERGDKDGDRALDRSEIVALSIAPVANGRVSFPTGGYSFGEDAGFSSKKHIEGALDDLRLASDKIDRARPIVRTYLDQIDRSAKAELFRTVEPLLSELQFRAFTASVKREPREMIVRLRGTDGDQEIRLPAAGPDLARQLEAMSLPAPRLNEARAAVDAYKVRLRLANESDRAELLTQLKDVFSEDELNDFRAAIERRPVVADARSILSSHFAKGAQIRIDAQALVVGSVSSAPAQSVR